jgi:hypothetical protein
MLVSLIAVRFWPWACGWYVVRRGIKPLLIDLSVEPESPLRGIVIKRREADLVNNEEEDWETSNLGLRDQHQSFPPEIYVDL